MKTVSVLEARNNLSALLAEVEKGEEVVIARRGRPVARLAPLGEPGNSAAALLRLVGEFRDQPLPAWRTPEQIDADIEAERKSWD